MYILTIDIGGTAIKLGLVNERGTICKRSSFLMPSDYTKLTTQLHNHIQTTYEPNFVGIAISSTGLVDTKTQEIGMSSKLYEGFGKHLVKHLRDHFKCPVYAENDGNCALLAEKWLGNGRDCSDFATIVLGTSVGGGIMVNNQLVHGKHLLAGEIGYMLFPTDKKPWEIWSIVGSTRALVEAVSEQKGQQLDGRQVSALFENGDGQAQASVRDFIEKLAVGCYTLQYLIDPEKILIGGGISSSSFLLPELQKQIQRLADTIPSTVVVPQVESCLFGNDSNLVGACYNFLVQSEFINNKAYSW
ncbi:ROK family protein [Enterococcus sp. DIV0876]|uniref:ROK family protein n=1 Tax=Enterococcus sp. DIV0876 TaxID=2774633 RepID=UPI003D2FC9B9